MRTHFWRKEMSQTVRHTRQRYTSEEENDQDDIRKRGGHIYDLKKDQNNHLTDNVLITN